MTRSMNFGQRIRDLRKERGLTQASVADAVGISRSHLATMERGGDLPGRDTLFALATFFHVSVDYLQTGRRPGGPPDGGQFVEDPDELALLEFWRGLTTGEKVTMLLHLRRGPDRDASYRDNVAIDR